MIHRRAIALGTAFVVLLMPLPVPATPRAEPCTPWTVRTVAAGLGSLENLEPDGTGGLLISASSRQAVERLTRDGQRTTVAAGMPSPGGLRVVGHTLYATTGDGAVNGLTGADDGTIEKIDLRTGRRETYARGLHMPNGLVFAPNGDAYTSRDLGADAAITKVPARTPEQPDHRWAELRDSNGLVIDPTNTWLYAASTFDADAPIWRIRLDDPRVIERVATVGGALDPLNGLDDLTIDEHGRLYVTANGMGRVFRVDPASGASCVIASGMQNPSAVKFGRGPGWPSAHLFVSGFDGRVLELVPPAASG